MRLMKIDAHNLTRSESEKDKKNDKHQVLLSS